MAVKFNETLINTGYFEYTLDGSVVARDNGKGNFEIDYLETSEGMKLGVVSTRRYTTQGTKDYIVPLTLFSDWVNNSGTPYASYEDLRDDLRLAFYRN